MVGAGAALPHPLGLKVALVMGVALVFGPAPFLFPSPDINPPPFSLLKSSGLNRPEQRRRRNVTTSAEIHKSFVLWGAKWCQQMDRATNIDDTVLGHLHRDRSVDTFRC
jgi:hypothetical protein